MNNRAFTISFTVAFFAVFLVYSYVNNTINEAKRGFGEEKSVVVASRDIKELDFLDETNLRLEPVPEKYVQPGAAFRIEDLKGTLAVAPIRQDEQVTRTRVTMAGVRPGLSRQVASGKRAVTIRISDETGLAKLLKPGDRVDVAATLDPTGSGNKMFLETRVILQDKQILATGKYVTNSVPGILEVDPYKSTNKTKVPLSEYNMFSTVTLEVETTEVTTLIFAAKNLDIYLALRNNDETGSNVEFPKAMMRDLMGGSPAVAAQPAGTPAKK